jgi:hypothetical protein
MARRLAELNAGLDVRSRLGDVWAPFLVSCRTEDAWLSPDNSRYLAGQIPGAQLLELPGVDHDPWVGATDDILAAVEEFVSAIGRDRVERRCPPSPDVRYVSRRSRRIACVRGHDLEVQMQR